MRITLIIALLAISAAHGGTMDTLRTGFANPGNDYRALPMEFDYAKPTEFADKLVEGGWGGAHFGYPNGGPGYLRDEAGWDQYTAAVKACKERGLNVWIYDEWGYPSGRAGGHVLEGHPEYEAQGLFYDSTDVPIKKAQPFEWRVPEGTPFYIALCDLDWNGRIVGQPTDLTDKVQDGILKIELQPGTWRLIAFVQNRLREGTHASIAFGPYVNILDPDAVKRFMEITHDAFYAHCGPDFGKTIKAVFNDEVSLMSGFLTDDTQPHPALAWYHGLPEIFLKRTGYDIRECLPALFNNVGADTARKRCDWYSMISEQVAASFFEQVREWCEAHKVASTGHLLWEGSLIFHANFYGSVFPSLRELEWPGIDVLGADYGHTSGSHVEGGPVTPKLIGSAAHIYDKKRTMSESFCFVTGKTPIEDLLAHIAWQEVLGINSFTTLSINDQYPPKSFRLLNDYTGRLSYMLTQGRFTADVAVLYPIASVWADFKPTNRHVHFLDDNPRAKDVDDAWRAISSEVLACQRDFDYLDEDAVRRAKVLGGKLVIGKNSYSVLMLPHVTTLEFATLKQIERFVAAGGTVISYETLPYTRADAGPSDEHRALVDDLWERKGVIHTETMRSFREALRSSGTPDLVVTPSVDRHAELDSASTPDVYYQHRILPDGDIFFLVNNSADPVTGDFAFRASGKAEVWNPLTGETSHAEAAKKNGTTTLHLTLPPRSGRFVVFGW
ncbi:MAG: hypothetical protein KBC96_04705 [Armatimonadetes bacterium]|nr:hypothetical protein [Armatimonadota bacterium]